MAEHSLQDEQVEAVGQERTEEQPASIRAKASQVREQRQREQRERFKDDAKNGGFAALCLRLYDLLQSLPVWGEVYFGGPARDWKPGAIQRASEIILGTFRLLEAQQSGRAATHRSDIERLLEENLGHTDAELGLAPGLMHECSEIEVDARYDTVCDALLDKLGVLAREFASAGAERPRKRHAAGERRETPKRESPPSDDDYLTRDEICAWLRLSKDQLARLTAKREIPFVPINKKTYVYQRGEINKWLKTRKPGGNILLLEPRR